MSAAAASIKARWAGLAAREQRMVAVATAVVLLALIWWVALAPALATLRASEEQRRTLDAQLQRMRALQAQAQAMQSQPRQSYDEALRLLEASVRQRLGTTARMVVAGERVTLTLTATPPDAFAQWLAQARVNARTVPSESRLVRNPGGQWDGTVVLTLPPR